MMPSLSATALRQSVPEQGTSLIRSLIWYGALWLVGKHLLPLDLAAPMTLLVTQVWSSAEKAIIRDHALRRQVIAMQLLPTPAPRKTNPMSDNIFAHLQSLQSKVADWLAAHPLDAQAASDLADVVNAFADEGDKLAKDEVAKLPTSLAAAGLPLASLLDQAEMAIKAEADAKLNGLAAARTAAGV